MMRKFETFKKFFACIIENNNVDKEETIKTLQYMGVRQYVYYPTFKNALEDLTKPYSVRLPDFILSEWYDEFYDHGVMEVYKKSRLKVVPIVILTNNYQLAIHEQAEKLQVASFINKPLRFGLLQEGIIRALAGKFNTRQIK